jgi:hypothetical protein
MPGTRTMSEKERTEWVSRRALENLPVGQTLHVIAVVARRPAIYASLN